MDIKISSKFIKVTFEANEPFCGLSVRMKGELLSDGFDASLASLEWIENHQTRPVDEKTKEEIHKLIEKDNENHSFKVLFMEE